MGIPRSLAEYNAAAIAEGAANGRAPFNKFARVLGAANGTELTLWRGSDSVAVPKQFDYPFLTAAATTLKLVSDNAGDNLAGTGARKVLVKGLDGVTGERKSLEVTLHATDGTIAVDVAGSWADGSRMRVTEVGTNGKNLGRISLYNGTLVAANLLAVIGAPTAGTTGSWGRGQTEQLAFRTPIDAWTFVSRASAKLLSNNTVSAFIFMREASAIGEIYARDSWNTKWNMDSLGGADDAFDVPLAIPPLSDVVMRMAAQTGANASGFIGGWTTPSASLNERELLIIRGQ